MKKLLNRALLPIVMLALLTVPVATVKAQAEKAVAVVSVASLDQLMNGIRSITQMSGWADAGNLATGMVGIYTQQIDRKKPIGAWVTLEGGEPRIVVFAPVKDLKLMLRMFRDQIGEPKDVGDGILQVAANRPQPFYIKQQGEWAFAAQQSSHLGNLPDDPSTALKGLNSKYDVAIRINMQNLPADVKQQGISLIRQGYEDALRQATPEDRELMEKVNRRQLDQLVKVFDELNEFTFGWVVDGKAGLTALEATVTALPGTELAKQMNQFYDSKSSHAGFIMPNSAVHLNFNSKIADDDKDQFRAMLSTARSKMLKEIDDDARLPDQKTRDAAKAIANSFLDIALETVESGLVDGGAALMLENDFQFVAGGYVADGSKMEATLRKLVDLAKNEPDFPQVNFNVANHAGVNFHTCRVPLRNVDNDVRKVFGEELAVTIGTGKKSVFIGLGKGTLDLLKTVIDRSATQQEKVAAPMQFQLTLSQILSFAARVNDDPKVKQLAEAAKQSAGKDHIMINVTPIDQGAAYRFVVEEGVIKLIGDGVRAQQGGGF